MAQTERSAKVVESGDWRNIGQYTWIVLQIVPGATTLQTD